MFDHRQSTRPVTEENELVLGLGVLFLLLVVGIGLFKLEDVSSQELVDARLLGAH